MDDRTSTNNSQVPSGNEPSDVLRQYIEALVEDVVFNGESFEAQKKWLRRYCELEHIDSDGLITNLSEFFDTMEELKSSASKTSVKLAYLQARDCYISTSIVDKLMESLAKGRSNNAEEEVGHGSAIGHDYVDLGLPSGTLWATCNLGASKPEDYGEYYAWGETEPKDEYDWETYKYAHGNDDETCELTKYCNSEDDGYHGFTDYLTELQNSDDPATANWGPKWQTPSKVQWDELIANSTNTWTTRNGINGLLFTSKKNGQSLFFPASGCPWFPMKEEDETGSSGYYWSRSLYTEDPVLAEDIFFDSHGIGISFDSRRMRGYSVRPVRKN